MAEKKIKTRVQSKHDIEANWRAATNFIPLAGEIIIYDPDSSHNVPRFKVGDGTSKVTALPFIDANLIPTIQAEFDTSFNSRFDNSFDTRFSNQFDDSFDSRFEDKISSGTTDPSASTTSQYYFKYNA